MNNITNEQVIIELAKRFGWKQEDPGGGALRFVINGGVTNFIPDHEPSDAGIVIERMYGYGCRHFHFESDANNKVMAYFQDPQWAESGASWKQATTKAALRAAREMRIGERK